MSPVTVREYTPGDLDECVGLYMKTYSKPPWNESWESKEPVAGYISRHAANNYFLGFVALRDGAIVAASIGFLKPWLKGMEYYIDEFFVDPDAHRQKIGTVFMSVIKGRLPERNVRAIVLTARRDFPARKFYESLRFRTEDDIVVMDTAF